MATITSL